MFDFIKFWQAIASRSQLIVTDDPVGHAYGAEGKALDSICLKRDTDIDLSLDQIEQGVFNMILSSHGLASNNPTFLPKRFLSYSIKKGQYSGFDIVIELIAYNTITIIVIDTA